MSQPPDFRIPLRPLGKTGLLVSPIGFGAFKIGRNQGIKYAQNYELPSIPQVQTLVNQLVLLGVNYFDTAPAYGLSEERLGCTLPNTPPSASPIVLSTKTGETFDQDQSIYDYSHAATMRSIERSLSRLGRDTLDLVFVHSNGQDTHILQHTDVVPTLLKLKAQGVIRAIGFSGKTTQGATAALQWADALMVEYHLQDRSHEPVIAHAASRNIGIIVKKGLASGRLPASDAIRFVLSNPGVTSLIIGSLNIDHFKSNLAAAVDAL